MKKERKKERKSRTIDGIKIFHCIEALWRGGVLFLFMFMPGNCFCMGVICMLMTLYIYMMRERCSFIYKFLYIASC